jgi:hypothetical protein
MTTTDWHRYFRRRSLPQVVDAGVEDGEQGGEEGADAAGALGESFVTLDALLELAQAAGLSVADEGAHLLLEDGEVGEDLSFKFGHWKRR